MSYIMLDRSHGRVIYLHAFLSFWNVSSWSMEVISQYLSTYKKQALGIGVISAFMEVTVFLHL